MKCPKCGSEGFEELKDEVDIGVGTQEHLIGGVCPKCGEMSVCPKCGAWDFQEHHDWCGALEEMT